VKIVADEQLPYLQEYFGKQSDVVVKPGRAITHAEVKEADILLVRSITHVNQHLLANTRVKFVGSMTAGADHLDIPWLEQAGIAWCTAAGFNAPPVADYVISTLAALQRKTLLLQQPRTAAVIGVGHVGKLVAAQLALLNFTVILCDPLRAAQEPDFNSVSLTDIADVDLISLHVPLTKTGEHPTYHCINADFLRRQKPGCVIINASRGAVIDSAALLQHGSTLHWCLDVWEREPHIDKEILAQCIFATPHIAGYSLQSKIRGMEMLYQAAKQHGLLPSAATPPLVMPTQQLRFSGAQHHWQDIVLGVFNPSIMTAMMRTQLLPATATGELFDEMRHKFHYRHEFAFTQVEADVIAADKKILEKLAIRLI
jgi:erythronate-4-phosphate dehydrogenase